MFQVEPNTKLFPAVFCLPSSQNMLQVELGKLKVWYTNIHLYMKNELNSGTRAVGHDRILFWTSVGVKSWHRT